MRKILFGLAAICLLAPALPAQAHFGMILPSEQVVLQAEHNTITLDLKFWHPFANIGLDLDKPRALYAMRRGERADLLPGLRECKERGHTAWQASYTLDRPGLYAFVLEPEPYWEPEENCFIIHHAKAYAAAFGDDEGWDEPLGLKTEIVPLVKPHGLYAGNLFQ
ncbi:MAG: DUF4198 domain-containing protein, partial [Deltaproteobacteria bacterium]|nr:DUF4198 domain-containing protein [Deltaproteobacteria bacterium]